MHAVIFITVGSKDEGLTIARTLVGERLVACVNVICGVTSIYRWKGRVEEGAECLLIAKTEKSLVDRVADRVRELHSYSIPEVIALDATGGLRDYLEWVSQSVDL